MARNVHASADTLDDELVNVKNFGKLRGNGFQAMFQFSIAHQFVWLFDGRRFALDVSENVGNLRDVTAHVGFQFGDLVMRFFEGHALVEFNMLLHVQPTVEILDADVVHVEIVIGSDRADAVEDVFRMLGARQRLHGHVGVGQDAVHCLGDCGRQLAGALKSYGARQSYGEVGEIAVPSAANADAIDFENAVDARYSVVDLRSNAGRGGVEQSVNGAASQPPAYGNHNSGHKQSGDRVGIAQPIDAKGAADENQDQPEYDHPGGPDVGGKMERVGFQRLAVVFVGDAAKCARAPPVHAHREQHHRKSGDGRLNFDSPEKESHCGLVDDPGASEQEQPGFDEGGKIFDFAMAVLMIRVGGLIGDADRKKSEDRGDQIESGMGRFRQNAEAARAETDHNFESGDDHRGQHGAPGGRAILRAHQFFGWDGR